MLLGCYSLQFRHNGRTRGLAGSPRRVAPRSLLYQTPVAPLIGGAGTSGESSALYVSGAEFPDGPCSMAAGTAAALAFLSQESRTRAGGIGGLRVPAPVTMDSFFFGIEERRG